MRVKVLFFSRLRDVTGTASLDVEIPPGQSLAELLASMYQTYPALGDWDPHILTAVGLEYAPRQQVLNEGDVVAIMPPVQGG